MDLRSVNLLSIIVRILLALLVGGLLGIERGRKNRPAGFRTYMLVCLGSALVMMTNQYVYQTFSTSDPVRMGAQVVSGIGFLGAGTILITSRKQVKGITTAAGLWASACIGLAIGIGFYEGAIAGGIAILLVMTLFQRIDYHIHHAARGIDLYLEFRTDEKFSRFSEYARSNGFEISEVQISHGKSGTGEPNIITLSAQSAIRRNHTEMISILSEAPGVEHIEEI